jgi:hypothetical protein
MDEYIIEDKTCMVRWYGARLNPRWIAIRKWIHSGRDLDPAKLKKWFRRRTIRSKGFPACLNQQEHQDIKAIFGILQVSCVVIDAENRVAVFKRPKKEKTGVDKITFGYSILRSWSPLEINMRAIQSQFISRTGFKHGDRLDISLFGAGYNELPTRDRFSPAYLFLVYKAACESDSLPVGVHGATDKKAGEEFIGFFEPKALWRQEVKSGGEVITFEGGMDRLILESTVTDKPHVQSGYLAEFNTACRIPDIDVVFNQEPKATLNKNLVNLARKLPVALGSGVVSNVLTELILKSLSKWGTFYNAIAFIMRWRRWE